MKERLTLSTREQKRLMVLNECRVAHYFEVIFQIKLKRRDLFRFSLTGGRVLMPPSPLCANDAPAVLQLPTFEPAGLLVGRPKVRGISICGCETIGFGPDLKATVRKHAASGFRQTDTIEVTEFARMLAKIGYSYTVGLWGPVSVEQVLVLSFILGETDTAGYWVGSAQFQTESENRGALHGLTPFVYEGQADAGRRILVARVKLFASAGATGFEVVVRQV